MARTSDRQDRRPRPHGVSGRMVYPAQHETRDRAGRTCASRVQRLQTRWARSAPSSSRSRLVTVICHPPSNARAALIAAITMSGQTVPAPSTPSAVQCCRSHRCANIFIRRDGWCHSRGDAMASRRRQGWRRARSRSRSIVSPIHQMSRLNTQKEAADKCPAKLTVNNRTLINRPNLS